MTKAQKKEEVVRESRGNGNALIPDVVPQVDRSLIEEAVQYINAIAASTVEKGCQGTLEIGSYLLDKFYGNDPARVHFRGPQKEMSFRELENHPGLQLSKSSLHNAVALAIQEYHLLSAGKGKLPASVSATHRVALLRIRPRDEKDKKAVMETAKLKLKLMQEVVDKEWSVRQLQERVLGMTNKLLAAESMDRGSKPDSGLRIPKLIEDILVVPIDKIVMKKRLIRMNADDRRSYRNTIEKAVDRLTLVIEQIDSMTTCVRAH